MDSTKKIFDISTAFSGEIAKFAAANFREKKKHYAQNFAISIFRWNTRGKGLRQRLIGQKLGKLGSGCIFSALNLSSL